MPEPRDWIKHLQNCQLATKNLEPWIVCGRLVRVSGLVMEAVGLKLAIGSTCFIYTTSGHAVEAEVVGFQGQRIFLMPTADVAGLAPGAKVVPAETLSLWAPQIRLPFFIRRRAEDRARQVPVGFGLLGRILDGAGRPLDKQPPPIADKYVPLYSRPVNPMDRAPVQEVLDVGVRAINGLLTVGRGQRLGLFAGSGVGKSVLLGMMARYTAAEIVVVGLIGERGREVKDFIENILAEEGLARSVVVAAPADTPPLVRLNGAAYATAIAEYFRDQGKQVLLIMDSLTRYAMAQREIALAIGEPPATKGYTPSVFARLPQLVERAGNGKEGLGSITAFYTVLSEGDDQQDPIADSARAILDGHIVLTRRLAEEGHYPAIDIEASISRVMQDIITPEELRYARFFKQLFSSYQRNRDFMAIGAYAPGNDRVLDRAVELYPALKQYLQQDLHEREDYVGSRAKLQQLLGTI